LKSKFGWQTSRIVTVNSGAQILFRKLPIGYSWGYLPKGPIGHHWNDIWSQIDKECKMRNAVFLKIEPDLSTNEFQQNHKLGIPDDYKVSPHNIQPKRSLLVDITGEEEDILLRMKQKTRYNIRLAGRKGVKVYPSRDVVKFYQLSKETGERDKFGVHSQEYFSVIYDVFALDGNCELIFGEFEGELVAAAMVFRSGSRAFYLYGASSNQYRNVMAPYLVQWEAIKWARSKGCTEYDLWGVPDYGFDQLEDQFLQRSDGLWGVYRFKRGFGGKLVEFVSAHDRVYNPFLYGFYRFIMKYNRS
jgi:lipid II:glycine glycyltransferase (peptidoglycan interpeptide bridge formation enzyme)